MASSAYRRIGAVLILAALAGCDNFQWGGAEVRIVPPPPAREEGPEPDARQLAELGMPTGSVLFHLVRAGGADRLIPVAEVSGDSLRTLRRPLEVSPEAYVQRFRETVIPPGSQFQVYRRGAPVGTFVLQGEGPVTSCGVPTATGNVTVVAAAADAPEFLAFRRGLAPEVRGEYTAPQVDRNIRTYASLIAERLILQQGLPRPRSWPGAQRDLQALEVITGGHPEMGATYLVGDSLAVGPADPQGYSVFYLAEFETRRGYAPFYSEVRAYRDDGKGAPRVIDHLDWDGSPGDEILIQVYGEDQAWYEVVSRDQAGRWRKSWQAERC
jgi:hypothetical protein